MKTKIKSCFVFLILNTDAKQLVALVKLVCKNVNKLAWCKAANNNNMHLQVF